MMVTLRNPLQENQTFNILTYEVYKCRLERGLSEKAHALLSERTQVLLGSVKKITKGSVNKHPTFF